MNLEQQNAKASRGVVTMAYGKQRYLDMAKALARSLKLHAPLVPRAILTDSTDKELGELFTCVIPHRPEFGANVEPKFYLDQFSPFSETLFIDSDCLVLSSLDSFWEAFSGQYFGVPGWRVLHRGDTDPYVDVDYVLERFKLDELPKFNGGTYYFRRCEETTRFFDTARKFFSQASSLRIANFRGAGAPDEPIIALVMALQGLSLTSMGDGGMLTPIQSTGPLRLDAIRGTCSFTKEGRKVSPEIIHFAGEYASCFAYTRECARLKAHFDGGRLPKMPLLKSYFRSLPWQFSRTGRTLGKKIVEFAAPNRIRGYAK